MVETLSNAAAAYRNAASQALPSQNATESGAAGQSDFGAMVRDMVADTIEAGHQAEQISADGVMGRADLNEVVTAVNNAELSLHTVVGLRDKVIQAYQDVIRMPI